MCTVQRVLTNVYSQVSTTIFKIGSISITSNSPLCLPFLKCLFSNNYRLTRSCKNSTERSYVPFTQLSPLLASYITTAQYQIQWSNVGTPPLAGLHPFFIFHEFSHALIHVCMFVCIVLCDCITCVVLHNHHHKGTPWSYSFSAAPILFPLPSVIPGSH